MECALFLPISFLVICSSIGLSDAEAESWKEEMNEEEMEIHKFAMENGLWTPEPHVLVGPPDIKSQEAPWGDREGEAALFLTRNNSKISVQVGTPVSLPCTIANVHDTETVSWIRRHDSNLLSLNDLTYSSDDRFAIKFDQEKQTWTLTIQHTSVNDSGIYVCQLSSHPPRAMFTSLSVLQSVSEITGSPEMYAEYGSNVSLVCRLRHFTRPPAYVFWYHEEEMINYDAKRGISVSIQGGESKLLLTNAAHKDNGNYTCQPANAMPSSIILHIIPGESLAAMHGGCSNPQPVHRLLVFSTTLLLSVLTLLTQSSL